MATYTANLVSHHSLGVSAVDVVTLSADYAQVEVLNRGSIEIYARADGGVPVVAGDDSHVIPAGTALKLSTPGPTTVVQLIASATCPYSVTGSNA